MSEYTIRSILQKNPAGLSRQELWKLSGLTNKQLQSTVSSMLRSKELVLYSGRLVLNDMECVKACLLDVNMENICSMCDRLDIARDDISEGRMKEWVDTYVDNMNWKDGRLVSKLQSDAWEISDLHNIKEILAKA